MCHLYPLWIAQQNALRILVAGADPAARDALIAMLGTQPDFNVVGEATTGPEAARLAQDLQPDVVLLDLEMPEPDGVAVLRALHNGAPRDDLFNAIREAKDGGSRL